MAAPPVDIATVDDHSLVQQGVGAFLKVFDDIKLRDEAASQLSAQNLPDIVVIDEDEFNKRVAEHEANQQKTNPGLLPTQ
jgi:DNA-binding NarL/FixJ family response regulator